MLGNYQNTSELRRGAEVRKDGRPLIISKDTMILDMAYGITKVVHYRFYEKSYPMEKSQIHSKVGKKNELEQIQKYHISVQVIQVSTG